MAVAPCGHGGSDAAGDSGQAGFGDHPRIVDRLRVLLGTAGRPGETNGAANSAARGWLERHLPGRWGSFRSRLPRLAPAGPAARRLADWRRARLCIGDAGGGALRAGPCRFPDWPRAWVARAGAAVRGAEPGIRRRLRLDHL